jgi:protein tyrosine phosphatase (PTP) superfamily phosphohydrolase (DUF442 family)/Ca2+-binding EF-hand superfamily protein
VQNAVRNTDDYTMPKFEPGRAGFAHIANVGFRSVVGLHTGEDGQKLKVDEERRLAEEAGLAFHHRGISKQALTEQEADRLGIELENLPKPVLLRRVSGKRSGAMTMMTRGLKLAWAAGLLLAWLAPTAAALGDDAELRKRFDRLDADRNGVITWQEAYPMRASEFLEMDRNLDAVVQSDEFGGRAMPLSAFDKNGDRRLQLDEYVGTHRLMFQRFDADQDGSIDLQEFAAAQAAVRSKP